VVINSGPIEAVDLLRDVPQEKWRELMLARRRFCEVALSYDCRCLVQFIADAEQMYRALGFASAEDMVRRGYALEPEEINIALEWLKHNPPDEPLPLDQAVKLGKHGGDRKSEKLKDQVGIARLKSNGSIERTLARLDRDGFTALAAKVRAGELSANAAAIQAGYRKKLVKRCPNCGHEW
jgi:hypothetical protein